MDSHSLEVLEFPKILKLISQEATTPYGRSFILGRTPLVDPETILQFQSQVTEAATWILEKGPFPLERVEIVDEFLERVEKGAVLNAEALWHSAVALKIIRLLQRFLQENKLILGSFQPLISQLHPEP